MLFPVPRRPGRLRLLAAAMLALLLVGCSRQLGASPPPTPADFPGIASFLAREGIGVGQVVSGDAGCGDPDLGRTAIRFAASGLDQAAPLVLRVYIFRDRAAYDRRRLSVDACAREWVSRANQLISIDASPFVLIGEGPAGPQFVAALRRGLQDAAGLGGSAPS